MIRSERENNIQSNLSGKGRDVFDGYILFDSLVQYYKSWFTFRQSDQYQHLESQSQKLADEILQISPRFQILVQPLATETQQLSAVFKEALDAQGQAIDLYRGRNFRSLLYGLTSIFSLSLAERIIPYVTSQVNFSLARENLKKREAEINALGRDFGLEHLSLKTQKLNIESKLRGLERAWVFESLERTLYYALTTLAHKPQARDDLFMECAKRLGVEVQNIRQDYTHIAVRTRPDLSTGELAVNAADSNSEGSQDQTLLEELDPIAYDYMNGYQHQESSDTHTDEASNYVPKRKILIDVNGKPVLLDELNEEDFEDLVKKSGSPLSIDQIIEIIGYLSDTRDAIKEYQRYPFTVQLGEYKGFHVVKKGRKGRILFKFYDGTLHIRFGDYYKVYADTHKWKG